MALPAITGYFDKDDNDGPDDGQEGLEDEDKQI
jgi:hypothetical protein